MSKETLAKSIREIPNFPIPGILFYDVTTLFKEPAALQELSDTLYEMYKDKGITKVVGIESRGFIMGPILATRLGAGFVPIRKPGKLPAETIEESYDKEYGKDTVQMHKDAINEDDVVLLHNDSHKFESTYVGLTIPTNRSVMFGSLSGSKLGIWVAHGEGKFSLPYDEDQYNVVAKYSYDEYPGNPNGSDYSIAGLASADGRHLAMMPHLERAIFPWQNGCYPADRKNSDQITPWIEAFVNARKWVEEKTK